jgi:hypothetical protein
MSENRKIAAIPVADVVGCSRLAGVDEERTLAQLGRLDEARSALKAGLMLNPSFTVSRARINWTAMSDDPAHPQQLVPILEGLRMAGCRNNDRRPTQPKERTRRGYPPPAKRGRGTMRSMVERACGNESA